MTKWDNLPIEILELMVDALPDESKHPPYPTNYMLVGKQWFDLYQRRYYKSVRLDLVPTDKTVQQILYSPLFKPGSFGRNITFTELQAPDNFFENDVRQDLPSLLIEHCPNVKNVTLSARMDEDGD